MSLLTPRVPPVVSNPLLDPDLLGLLYDTTATEGVPPLLLSRLREQLRAECLQLLDCSTPPPVLLGTQCAVAAPALEDFHRAYTSLGCATDPLVAQLAGAGDGALRQNGPDVGVSPAGNCAALLAAHGLAWALGGAWQPQRGRVVLLIARRPAAAGPFDTAAAGMLKALLPHLRRAAELREQIGRRLAAAEHAANVLRQLPLGYLLTDSVGRCIEANEAFLQGVERAGMRVVTGRLRLQRRDHQLMWEQALEETHATGAGRTLRLPGVGTTLFLKPWEPGEAAGSAPPGRLILGALLESAPVSSQQEDLAARSARLTRAELEVLGTLLTGQPAKLIARQRGASIHTVRNQITAILEKMGFHSQRELIASFGASGYSGFEDSQTFLSSLQSAQQER